MNNAKLTVSDMKEMVELFIRHKLNVIRIGDFKVQKSHYESESLKDPKSNLQEDPLFYSAPSIPPEIQEMLSSMMKK